KFYPKSVLLFWQCAGWRGDIITLARGVGRWRQRRRSGRLERRCKGFNLTSRPPLIHAVRPEQAFPRNRAVLNEADNSVFPDGAALVAFPIYKPKFRTHCAKPRPNACEHSGIEVRHKPKLRRSVALYE